MRNILLSIVNHVSVYFYLYKNTCSFDILTWMSIIVSQTTELCVFCASAQKNKADAFFCKIFSRKMLSLFIFITKYAIGGKKP